MSFDLRQCKLLGVLIVTKFILTGKKEKEKEKAVNQLHPPIHVLHIAKEPIISHAKHCGRSQEG
jgi:hypothetical protein